MASMGITFGNRWRVWLRRSSVFTIEENIMLIKHPERVDEPTAELLRERLAEVLPVGQIYRLQSHYTNWHYWSIA